MYIFIFLLCIYIDLVVKALLHSNRWCASSRSCGSSRTRSTSTSSTRPPRSSRSRGQASGFRLHSPGSGVRVQDPEFRVQGSWLRVRCIGFIG